MYHGEDAVHPAEKRYISIASGTAPEKMDVLNISKNEISIVELLKQAGFASSNSDAKRLINGRGIKVNGEILHDSSELIKNDCVLSCGKRRFLKVHIRK